MTGKNRQERLFAFDTKKPFNAAPTARALGANWAARVARRFAAGEDNSPACVANRSWPRSSDTDPERGTYKESVVMSMAPQAGRQCVSGEGPRERALAAVIWRSSTK